MRPQEADLPDLHALFRKRLRWREDLAYGERGGAVRSCARRAVLIGAALGLFACGDAPPDPGTGAPRARAEAQVLARSERRATEARRVEIRPAERLVQRAAALRTPPPARATARLAPARTGPERLDLALLAMDPAEVMRTLSEIQGPLEGAHYVLQRESQVEVRGERARSVEGELSLVDCRRVDPDDPSRGRELWIGGLRLDGAPEVFEGRIETRRVIEVYGREIHYSARWQDAYVLRGALRGFARTLDAEVEEEGADETRTWRRELVLDPAVPSPVVFHGERDACPLEITLNVVVRDEIDYWEPRVREDGSVQPYRVAFDPGEPIARAMLVARFVSPEPEIIDPLQRTLRWRRPAPAVTQRELPRQAVERLPLTEAGHRLRAEQPKPAVLHRAIEIEPRRAP